MFVTFRQASDKDKQRNATQTETSQQEQAVETIVPNKQQEGLDLEQGNDAEPIATDETSAHTDTTTDPEENSDIPNALYRWSTGAILGIINAAFSLSMENRNFYTVPTPAIGTLPSDIFMFVVGILAARRGWLRPSSLKLNPNIRWSYLGMTIVVAVYVTVTYMLTAGRITMTSTGLAFANGLFGGIFLVDFSLVCLHFFHCFFNKMNWIGKRMGEAAYAVYLIHYLFTVIATAVFIKVYNHIYNEEVINFVGSTISSSVLRGPADGAIHLFGGFVVCTILVQAVVWPLAYGLKQLPGVKQVL